MSEKPATPVALCDCEGKETSFSFRLSVDKYVCDWDDIHFMREMKGIQFYECPCKWER